MRLSTVLFSMRGGSNVNDVHVRAEADYMAGMKYKDIAAKYEVTENTVKSWKKRYGWNRGKCAHKKQRCASLKNESAAVISEDGTEETLKNGELTEKQRVFCIYYSKLFNAAQSYQRAYGCKYETAMTEGCKLLRNPKVKAELDRLKEIKRQQIVAEESDFVELQMRIAFGDIGNVVSFNGTGVKLNDSSMIDTQLIESVKEGKDGITVKMKDPQKAIDWLTRYFQMNPYDKHKMEFDKRKLELELIKLEMQAKEPEDLEKAEDNFLDALNQSAQEVWQDE